MKKQVAQWATIAHLGASMTFEDIIIKDAQRQVTLNQELIQKNKILCQSWLSSSILKI